LKTKNSKLITESIKSKKTDLDSGDTGTMLDENNIL
jgi:hypothetical protein